MRCRRLRVLGRLLAINLSLTIEYRGGFLVMQAHNLVTPVVSLLVWEAVLASGAPLPVSAEYLVTYFVLVSVVNMLTSSWTAMYLAQAIRLGELARWMIRPASTHWEGVSNNVAEKLVKLVLLVPMVAVLALIFHRRMRLPVSPDRWLEFAAATVLAAAIVFALNVLTGSLAFWFDDVSGFNRALSLVSGVLSGATVPLALMPSWSSAIIAVEPFRFTVSFPLEALLGPGAIAPGSGALAQASLAAGFTWQAAWTAVFLLAAWLVWRVGLRSYSAAGA